MHGCMLWNNANVKENFFSSHSTLITWMDKRCDTAFLDSLPNPKMSVPVSTGFGCATLFWLKKYLPNLVAKYNSSGTVMDYLVASLCGLAKPVMSTQNAMSWGYYDFCRTEWNWEILEKNQFPTRFLPDIVDAGVKAGSMYHDWHGIKAGTPVLAALGDMQCSVSSCNPDPFDKVFNLSTSAQISMVAPFELGKENYITQEAKSETKKLPPAVIFVPYFGTSCLQTAASLNGGAVYELLVKALLQWTRQFAPSVTIEDIYAKLEEKVTQHSGPRTYMNIIPTIYGERHSPDARASVSNIGIEDVSFPTLACELANSIIQNVVNMFESGKSRMECAKIGRVLGCGTAFKKNHLLKEALQKTFPEVVCDFDKTMDAAFGAAIATGNVVKLKAV